MLYDALLTEEEKALRDEVRQFVRDEVPADLLRAMDRDEIKFPYEFIAKLAEHSLRGIRFPKKWGGRELPWTAEVVAEEEVGVLGVALGCAFVMSSIVGEALNVFGTDEQKERYLRPIITGTKIPEEALTEPRGGSDFFGATTRAVADGDSFILNGQKRFVVGAEAADFFTVYCNTDPKAPLHQRISMFIVEKGPGVQVEHVYGLLGCRGTGVGRLVFRNCRVPKENLVGKLGYGALLFDRMMIPERLTSAAASVGGGRGALEVAIRYSDRRVAFGKKIRKFQAVSSMIADAMTRLDAARGLVYGAAKTVDRGMPHRRLVSEAKKFATEASWSIVNIAMQVLGGIGYTNVYPLERYLRDSRLCLIWTGTSQIMDALIQHETFQEFLGDLSDRRNVEMDAMGIDAEKEKIYTDEDMWRNF
ncbi:MAG: acyl-CoA/acyl-ACP dehydrogenase [Deltaproteobacteria bacterium]|jgi:acyl-CoA dehydrogenase|nr:acyl-CoA/acyl-ACP dehydrogenase [Deltaproteobacteria bacterium]MDO9210100.1 acyl-CoA dehydrogenase family protein [Deltaproteobacteria bacterium]